MTATIHPPRPDICNSGCVDSDRDEEYAKRA